MSAAKMVADSTQSDLAADQPTKSRHRKSSESKKAKKSKKNAKKGAKQKSTEEEEEELLNDPDLDLKKTVKDIGDYIRDRQEMLNQMFNAVHGASLQRALPDVLKELPVEELKQRCLEQLEVLSKKRIRRIIAGDNPATISSSGTEDETTDEDMDIHGNVTSAQQAADSTSQTGEGNSETLETGEANVEAEDEQAEAEAEMSDEGEWRTPPPDDSEEDVELEEEEEEDPEEAADDGSEEESEEEVEEEDDVEEEEMEEEEQEENAQSSLEEENDEHNDQSEKVEQEIEDEVKKNLDDQPVTGASIFPVLTQNQMELLELEMRARAIKAMLKKHQGKKPS